MNNKFLKELQSYCLFLLCFMFFTSTIKSESKNSSMVFEGEIEPIMQKYCYECHDEDVQKADLRLDILNPDMLNASNADLEHWHDALNYLQIGEMPPAKKKQPSTVERRALITWISEQLKLAENKYASDEDKIRLKRLTRYEYNNTMQDLLGLDMDFTEGLPIEGSSAEGFKNSSKVLSLSPIQYEYYIKHARKGIESALFLGEKPKTVDIKYSKPSENKFVSDPKAVYDEKNKVTIISPKYFTMYCQIEDQFKHLYPYKGEVRVLVNASITRPEGKGIPSMQVNLGCKTGGRVEPTKQMGDIVELDLKPGEIKEYEFKGRIEEFPANELDSEDDRFSGFFLKIKNIYDDGNIPEVQFHDKKKKKPIYTIGQLPDIHVHSVQIQYPFIQSWPPASHENLLGSSKVDSHKVKGVIKNFAEKAFRGPVSKHEIDEYLKYFNEIRTNFESLEKALSEVFISMLISPRFLYHIELPKESDDQLTNYELANRLSYFLWSTMPDRELIELARKKRLIEPKILQQQVNRMIDDKKFEKFIDNFGSQWLGLDKIDQVAINPAYYKDFDEALKKDMVRETLSFLDEIFRKNLSALNVIDSDFSMINMRLADHYGVEGANSSLLKPVKVNREEYRGGILSHGSILMANSDGEDSHPIKRAVWLLDSILGTPPGNPPADVPDLDEENPDLTKLSLKKQLEIHRKKESCNDCHYKLDPWGIAFENFDAIGLWRDRVHRIVRNHENKKRHSFTDVDSHSILPNGVQIKNLAELKQYLLTNKKDQFAKALTNKILTYALGRSLKITEQDEENKLNLKFIKSGYKFRDLVEEIVISPLFMTRSI